MAGEPAPSTPILGSYERWCTVIGGILEQIQVAGFLADLDQLYAETDEETPQWERFLERWLELLGPRWVTLYQLIQALGNDTRLSSLEEILPTELCRLAGQKRFPVGGRQGAEAPGPRPPWRSRTAGGATEGRPCQELRLPGVP